MNPVVLEFLRAERAREEAAMILLPVEFNDECASEFRFVENHEMTLASGIGTTHFPPIHE